MPNIKISDNEFQKFNNADEKGQAYTELKDIGEIVFLDGATNTSVKDGIIKVNRNKFNDMNNSNPKVIIKNRLDNVLSLNVKYDDNEGATLDKEF